MTTVVNGWGTELDFEAVANLMDDDLRERVHAELAPCTDQEFFDRYAELWAEAHPDEEWEFSKESPAY